MNLDFSTDQKDFFVYTLRGEYTQKLRKELRLYILRYCGNKENKQQYTPPFDIDIFDKKMEINDIKYTISLVDEAIEWLKTFGWKADYCYGGTCLSIYDTKLPDNIESQIEKNTDYSDKLTLTSSL